MVEAHSISRMATTGTEETNSGLTVQGSTSPAAQRDNSSARTGVAEKWFGSGVTYIPREGDVIVSYHPETNIPKEVIRNGVKTTMPRPGDNIAQPESGDAAVIESRRKEKSEEAYQQALELIKTLKSEIY